MNHLKVIVFTVLATVLLAFGVLWLVVDQGLLHLNPDARSAAADPLVSPGQTLSKKSANFICEVTVSMPQRNLTSEPKVYTDFWWRGWILKPNLAGTRGVFDFRVAQRCDAHGRLQSLCQPACHV